MLTYIFNLQRFLEENFETTRLKSRDLHFKQSIIQEILMESFRTSSEKQ